MLCQAADFSSFDPAVDCNWSPAAPPPLAPAVPPPPSCPPFFVLYLFQPLQENFVVFVLSCSKAVLMITTLLAQTQKIP